MLSFKHHNFDMLKHTMLFMIGGFSAEMFIYAFLLEFFSHARQKE